MKLYHYSNHLFKNLDYKELSKITNKTEGLWGLYVCFEKTWNKGFGKYCYEIELHNPKIYNQDSRELFINHKNKEFILTKREKLLNEKYNFIKIIEHEGNCEEAIIIDFNAAKIIKVTEES